MPYLYLLPPDGTQPLLHQPTDIHIVPISHRRSRLKMPITDPTFQHSDEDWTQITQPRLRKRVQNRVSQRKHRKGFLLLLAWLCSCDGRYTCHGLD